MSVCICTCSHVYKYTKAHKKHTRVAVTILFAQADVFPEHQRTSVMSSPWLKPACTHSTRNTGQDRMLNPRCWSCTLIYTHTRTHARTGRHTPNQQLDFGQVAVSSLRARACSWQHGKRSPSETSGMSVAHGTAKQVGCMDAKRVQRCCHTARWKGRLVGIVSCAKNVALLE